jgi:hypothetical protein
VNTNSTSKYFSETLTNIKDAYHQLPYDKRNNPSLRKPNHPNDQLHLQEEETWPIPGGYIQSPQYQQTRGVDPADNETGESSEEQRHEEQKPEEEGSDQDEKDKRTTEEKDDNMSESDSGNKQELKGVRIPNPKTLTGHGEDRGAKRVNTWIY